MLVYALVKNLRPTVFSLKFDSFRMNDDEFLRHLLALLHTEALNSLKIYRVNLLKCLRMSEDYQLIIQCYEGLKKMRSFEATTKNSAASIYREKLRLRELLERHSVLVEVKVLSLQMDEFEEIVDEKLIKRRLWVEFESPELSIKDHKALKKKFPNWVILCPCKSE